MSVQTYSDIEACGKVSKMTPRRIVSVPVEAAAMMSTSMPMQIAQVPGWPGYAVTDDGVVMSYWRRFAVVGWRNPPRLGIGEVPRVLPQFDRKDRRGALTGYRSVCLSRGGRHKNLYVHEIVLSAFRGPRPSPDHEALHGNGERGDNRLDNLRWGTVAENAADRERHGRVYRGETWHRARDTREEAPEPAASGVQMVEYEGAFDDILLRDGVM